MQVAAVELVRMLGLWWVCERRRIDRGRGDSETDVMKLELAVGAAVKIS